MWLAEQVFFLDIYCFQFLLEDDTWSSTLGIFGCSSYGCSEVREFEDQFVNVYGNRFLFLCPPNEFSQLQIKSCSKRCFPSCQPGMVCPSFCPPHCGPRNAVLRLGFASSTHTSGHDCGEPACLRHLPYQELYEYKSCARFLADFFNYVTRYDLTTSFSSFRGCVSDAILCSAIPSQQNMSCHRLKDELHPADRYPTVVPAPASVLNWQVRDNRAGRQDEEKC